jgi:hypothetical protein
MRHVDPAIMMDMVEQRASKSKHECYEQHLTDCRRCAAEYDSWWTFLSGLGPSSLTDAPTELINECIAIYRKPEPLPSRIQRASLLFDSFLQPLAAAGLRGTPAESRQIVLHTQVFDVHMKISGKESNRRIMAQLLPSQPDTLVDGAQIQLHIPGCPAQVTRSNELGQFTFSEVPNRPLSFFIELPSSGSIIQFSVQGV